MKYLAEKEWVLSKLDDSNIRIADCRFKLGSPDEGRSLYDHSHIPHAVYFDLEKDLSGPVREHGGRHPLPDPAQLKKSLRKPGSAEIPQLLPMTAEKGLLLQDSGGCSGI